MAVSNDEKFEYCLENADADALERIKVGECSVDDVYKTLVGSTSESETNTEVESLPEGISINQNGKMGIVKPAFAKWFISNTPMFFIKTHGKNTSKYIYDDCGVYNEVSDDIFRGAIKDKLPQELQYPNIIEEIFKLIKMESSIYKPIEEINADENIVNCKNGILHLDTKELTPHTPDIFSTFQIKFDYLGEHPKQPENEYFLNFLVDLSNKNAGVMQLLVEFAGLTFSNIKGHRTKKALFLVGKGDSGKSKFRDLLTNIVGSEYSSSADLETIEARFGGYQLLGKRIAGASDMKFTTVNQLEMFKQLTGGDPIFAEKKGFDGFSSTYNGVLCFCTNKMPKFGGDKGEHVYNRCIIVECNNVIPPDKQDVHILDKMLTEGDYIFTLCINAVCELMKRNYRFEIPDVCKQALAQYEVDNDTVLSFIEECTERQPIDTIGNGLRTSDVHRIYSAWCAENKEKALGRTLFYARLSELGYGEKRKSNGYEYYTAFKVKQSIINEYYPRDEI